MNKGVRPWSWESRKSKHVEACVRYLNSDGLGPGDGRLAGKQIATELAAAPDGTVLVLAGIEQVLDRRRKDEGKFHQSVTDLEKEVSDLLDEVAAGRKKPGLIYVDAEPDGNNVTYADTWAVTTDLIAKKLPGIPVAVFGITTAHDKISAPVCYGSDPWDGDEWARLIYQLGLAANACTVCCPAVGSANDTQGRLSDEYRIILLTHLLLYARPYMLVFDGVFPELLEDVDKQVDSLLNVIGENVVVEVIATQSNQHAVWTRAKLADGSVVTVDTRKRGGTTITRKAT